MKKKPDAIDILAFIACVVITIGCVITSICVDTHVCSKCGKMIHRNDDCVICDGKYYYHVKCYREKLKEESK